MATGNRPAPNRNRDRTPAGFPGRVKDAQMRAKSTRVDWVDHAKGLCIIMVVMMHSTLGVEKAAETQGWLGAVVAWAQPFRMPDFFLLSGLFMSAVIGRDWRFYLDRKLVHFGYFYVLWNTIQFALKSGPGLVGEPLSKIACEYLYTLAIAPIGILWFLNVLALFFVVAKLFARAPWLLFAIAAALHLGHDRLYDAALALGEDAAVLIGEFANRLVFFVAGWLGAPAIFRFADRVRAHKPASLALLLAWAIGNGALVELGWSHLTIVSLPLGLIGALAVVAVAVFLSDLPFSRFVSYCGENSIVIFLSFFLPMVALRSTLLWQDSLTDIGTISALVTIGGVLWPLGLLYVINRFGHGRFLFERPAFVTIMDLGEIDRRRREALNLPPVADVSEANPPVLRAPHCPAE